MELAAEEVMDASPGCGLNSDVGSMWGFGPMVSPMFMLFGGRSSLVMDMLLRAEFMVVSRFAWFVLLSSLEMDISLKAEVMVVS